jgi:hypothetical protein
MERNKFKMFALFLVLLISIKVMNLTSLYFLARRSINMLLTKAYGMGISMLNFKMIRTIKNRRGNKSAIGGGSCNDKNWFEIFSKINNELFTTINIPYLTALHGLGGMVGVFCLLFAAGGLLMPVVPIDCVYLKAVSITGMMVLINTAILLQYFVPVILWIISHNGYIKQLIIDLKDADIKTVIDEYTELAQTNAKT